MSGIGKSNRSGSSYLRSFLSSKSAENLIGLFACANKPEKEITESWAMLRAAQRYIPKLDQHVVIVVGDGTSPRTAALFSYFTRCVNAVSVDPLLNLERWEKHCQAQERLTGERPRRIHLMKGEIGKVILERVEGVPLILVVWPHSHAPMTDLRLPDQSIVSHISMPCCTPISPKFARIPHLTYEDPRVWSEKRTVHVWVGEGLREESKRGEIVRELVTPIHRDEDDLDEHW